MTRSLGAAAAAERGARNGAAVSLVLVCFAVSLLFHFLCFPFAFFLPCFLPCHFCRFRPCFFCLFPAFSFSCLFSSACFCWVWSIVFCPLLFPLSLPFAGSLFFLLAPLGLDGFLFSSLRPFCFLLSPFLFLFVLVFVFYNFYFWGGFLFGSWICLLLGLCLYLFSAR